MKYVRITKENIGREPGMKRRRNSVVLLLLFSLLLSSCLRVVRTEAVIDFRADEYPEESGYSTGDFFLSSEGIEKVEVWWDAGSVGISTGDGFVSASESGKDLSGDDSMHWRLSDGVLTIRFSASGRRVKLKESDKNLHLVLPEGADISVSTSSSPVRAGELKGGNIAISTQSGNVSLASVKAESLSVCTSSGSVGIGETGAESIVCSTLSGRVDLSSLTTERLALSSSSGPVKIGKLSGGEAEVSSVSGSVSITVSVVQSLSVKTSSGDVVLVLPENSAGVLFSTRSGRFTGDCGYASSGERSVEVETSSGNLTVIRNHKEKSDENT